MKLYEKINISLEQFVIDEIKECIRNKIKPGVGAINEGVMKQFRLYLSGDTELTQSAVDSINSTLTNHNLPEMHNILAFARLNRKGSYGTLHIDENDATVFKSSIIFPLEGCENAFMYWAIGSYNSNMTTHPLNGTKYSLLTWNSDVVVLDELEITTPTVVRVDIPHDAYTNNEWPRIVFSIRLRENLSIEEIMERFKP